MAWDARDENRNGCDGKGWTGSCRLDVAFSESDMWLWQRKKRGVWVGERGVVTQKGRWKYGVHARSAIAEQAQQSPSDFGSGLRLQPSDPRIDEAENKRERTNGGVRLGFFRIEYWKTRHCLTLS